MQSTRLPRSFSPVGRGSASRRATFALSVCYHATFLDATPQSLQTATKTGNNVELFRDVKEPAQWEAAGRAGL
ncbi:hypothetical protein DPEC_G00063810 [Dallia pectoralis]|uniref:Uncharacterized protein n=1 Tax=Dallia pectoralis TaxID=75939 RepID=A0ACC2H7K5_DALPE|nr:hypothetical protein DPEC_G00063810 [Dallia pectoralis]